MHRGITVLALAVVAAGIGAGVGGATPSGKNGLISFRRYFNDDQTNGALFKIRPDGTGEKQITFPAADELDTNENWSPNGSQLVYEHITPTTDQIYIVGVDGSNPHPVFSCPGDDSCLGAGDPSWSPNGQWIAFELVKGPVEDDFAADVSIWEVQPDGTGLHQVTHPVGFHQSEDSEPQWSPDGSRLVFERDTFGRSGGSAIWTASSTDGGDLQRVSPPGVNGSDHPDWSPDGRWIVFRTGNEAPGAPKLYVAHPDGTGLHTLLQVPAHKGNLLSYSFSPDGTQLVFATAPGFGPDGRADVYIGRLDSQERLSGVTPLTRTNDWESSPRWGTAPLDG